MPHCRGASQLFIISFLILLLLGADGYAARKDYKGLFGSYRRERFTENEGRDTSFGIDAMLSTLFPLSPLVRSRESTTVEGPLHYATFFNVELNFFLNLFYHWQIYGRIGYYTYETRKENTVFTNAALPLFHQFELTAVPAIAGVKYRFGKRDLVPYVGGGVGIAYVERRGFYDFTTVQQTQYLNVLTFEFTVGAEFYFTSSAGIRLEASGFYLKLPQSTFAPSSSNIPELTFQSNPWSIRYASGVFFLF